MKIIYFSHKITSHHVAIVAMTSLDQKLYSELRSALHFRYSIVIEDGYFFLLGIPKITFCSVDPMLNPNIAELLCDKIRFRKNI